MLEIDVREARTEVEKPDGNEINGSKIILMTSIPVAVLIKVRYNEIWKCLNMKSI